LWLIILHPIVLRWENSFGSFGVIILSYIPPIQRNELTGLIVERMIVLLIRSALPMPCSRSRCNYADNKFVSAAPESINEL